jgi:hypothetical protein
VNVHLQGQRVNVCEEKREPITALILMLTHGKLRRNEPEKIPTTFNVTWKLFSVERVAVYFDKNL